MACPLSEPPSGNGVPANPEIWVSVAVPVSTSVCENAGDAAPTLATAAPPSARAKAVVVFNDVYLGIDSNSLRLDGRRPSVIPMDRRREPRRGFSDRSRLGRQRDCRHGAAIGASTANGLRPIPPPGSGANLDWLVEGRKIAPHIRVVITTSGYFPSILDCDDDCRTGPRCHFATRLFVTADDQGERRVPTHLHLIHMAHQGLASRPGSSRKTARLSQNHGNTSHEKCVGCCRRTDRAGTSNRCWNAWSGRRDSGRRCGCARCRTSQGCYPVPACQ